LDRLQSPTLPKDSNWKEGKAKNASSGFSEGLLGDGGTDGEKTRVNPWLYGQSVGLEQAKKKTRTIASLNSHREREIECTYFAWGEAEKGGLCAKSICREGKLQRRKGSKVPPSLGWGKEKREISLGLTCPEGEGGSDGLGGLIHRGGR